MIHLDRALWFRDTGSYTTRRQDAHFLVDWVGLSSLYGARRPLYASGSVSLPTVNVIQPFGVMGTRGVDKTCSGVKRLPRMVPGDASDKAQGDGSNPSMADHSR